MTRPIDAIRIWPMSYTEEGRPRWTPTLTSTDNTSQKILPAPPDKVIPLIFVPGIMGSNLMDTSGRIVWRPDVAGLKDVRMDAAGRQARLSPSTTKVDTRLSVKGKQLVSPPEYIPAKLAEKRGWGSIFWNSYGSFITWLEAHANKPTFFDFTLNKLMVNAIWQPLLDGVTLPDGQIAKLTKEELIKVGDYHFPVWCVGYNWLQSNEESGKYLAKKINDAINDAKELFGSKAASKAIVITHSMGGLVTRAACNPTMSNAENNVLGVIHGVMPAIGAAAAYKRIHAGFEGPGHFDSVAQYGVDTATMFVLGNNGREVTAVLGHAPGGLQLLPTKRYLPQGWLKIQKSDGSYHTITGDPYQTIYREQRKWWRLINQEWLDPAANFTDRSKRPDPAQAWRSYRLAIEEAEAFHDKLDQGGTPYYHPVTYAHFGDDPKQKAWGEIRWNLSGDSINKLPSKPSDAARIEGTTDMQNDARGTVKQIREFLGQRSVVTEFELGKQNMNGDGTVPACSGVDPKYVVKHAVHATRGYDHQGSFNPSHNSNMMSVLFAIAKIVQDAH